MAAAAWISSTIVDLIFHPMLYPVVLLGALAVVPFIHRTDQIASNSSDAIKRYLLRVVAHFRILAVDLYLNAYKRAPVLFPTALHISKELPVRKLLLSLYRYTVNFFYHRLNPFPACSRFMSEAISCAREWISCSSRIAKVAPSKLMGAAVV